MHARRLLCNVWIAALVFTAMGSAALPAAGQTIFSDDFSGANTWSMFEELVGSDYRSGIGQVSRVASPSNDANGGSLLVFANSAASGYSNHLIANKRLSNSGMGGTLVYDVYCRIDPTMANDGQTGPEISMQDTRETLPGQFRTTTAGIQYVDNRYAPAFQQWNVWTGSGSVAGWVVIPNSTDNLVAGQWYHLALTADFDANRYLTFNVSGPGVDHTYDLSGYSIVPESKFTETAFWLTLEGENMWSGPLREVHQFAVNYDDARLTAVPEPSTLVLLGFAAACIAWWKLAQGA